MVLQDWAIEADLLNYDGEKILKTIELNEKIRK
jgi:hypothetical protein